MPHNEQRLKVNYYLAWARIYLRRGGAVANSAGGVWAITEARSGIHEVAALRRIHEEVQDEERERARLKRKAREEATETPASEVIVMDAQTGPVDEEDWKTSLLGVLGSMARMPSSASRSAFYAKLGSRRCRCAARPGTATGCAIC